MAERQLVHFRRTGPAVYEFTSPDGVWRIYQHAYRLGGCAAWYTPGIDWHLWGPQDINQPSASFDLLQGGREWLTKKYGEGDQACPKM